jgi:hypothetical protein
LAAELSDIVSADRTDGSTPESWRRAASDRGTLIVDHAGPALQEPSTTGGSLDPTDASTTPTDRADRTGSVATRASKLALIEPGLGTEVDGALEPTAVGFGLAEGALVAVASGAGIPVVDLAAGDDDAADAADDSDAALTAALTAAESRDCPDASLGSAVGVIRAPATPTATPATMTMPASATVRARR